MSGGAPGNRADRWRYIWSQYRCASVRETSIPYDGSRGKTPDWDDFIDPVKEPFFQNSYLSPAYFHYVSANMRNRFQIMTVGGFKFNASKAIDDSWGTQSMNYVPRLPKVGLEAQKIFSADGTRYLPDEELLDHDPAPLPNYYGAFTEASAWRSANTAWGVRGGSLSHGSQSVNEGSESEGRNLSLSYRHGRPNGATDATNNTGTMTALFFDGHVEKLSDKQSREPEQWYPSGTILDENEGMTRVDDGYVVP